MSRCQGLQIVGDKTLFTDKIIVGYNAAVDFLMMRGPSARNNQYSGIKYRIKPRQFQWVLGNICGYNRFTMDDAHYILNLLEIRGYVYEASQEKNTWFTTSKSKR